MKVSSKSHGAENVEEYFTLAKRLVSCENWGGLRWKRILKSRIEKTPVFKKNENRI